MASLRHQEGQILPAHESNVKEIMFFLFWTILDRVQAQARQWQTQPMGILGNLIVFEKPGTPPGYAVKMVKIWGFSKIFHFLEHLSKIAHIVIILL